MHLKWLNTHNVTQAWLFITAMALAVHFAHKGISVFDQFALLRWVAMLWGCLGVWIAIAHQIEYDEAPTKRPG
jgi:hypothetical protein